ncbi:MAG: glycosyltransferase family 4 protein, partial [Dehalococcoidia bacterium]
TAWGSDVLVQPKQNPLAKFTARYALKKMDMMICLFPINIAKGLIAKLGIDSSKMRGVLLGVNTAEFSESHRDDNIRQSLGIESSQPVVISTRALAPIYDVETLVKAIPLVLAETPQAQFVIAGTGRQQGYLEELARDLAVSNNTKFIGWVPRAGLPGYLSSADIYVSSSLSDGASNSLLEAMACGLAPVVTDIPANRPWVKEGENGFLFPPRDCEALASSIVALLKDRQMREDFGRRSRDIVQQNAEEETEMGKLERIYHELIGASPVVRNRNNRPAGKGKHS